MNTDAVALAIALDERYTLAASTMLNSLARSLRAPDKLPVKALMPEATSRTAMQRLVSYARRCGLRIETLLIGEDFSKLPVAGPYTRAVYLSLLLPELLRETRRILYLDVDLIVMRDVSELVDVDLGDHPLAAARDGFISESPRMPTSDDGPSPSPLTYGYFNAGVLVINADVWRRERIGRPRKPWHAGYPRTPNWDVYEQFAERRRSRPGSRSTPLDRGREVLKLGGSSGSRPPLAPNP